MERGATMRVLFALTGLEGQEEKIVQTYKEKYGENLEYLSVYFFKSLIDTVKKSAPFDRIIIHENFEAKGKKNKEVFDQFIFENLDALTDVSNNVTIIFLCNEQRKRDDKLLNRLFNMGIYNILIGEEGTFSRVCELIKNPMTKKDAKRLLEVNLDTETYEDPNKVSEIELRNIIDYYEKNINNQENIISGFDNNLYEQYTMQKLREIIKFLPSKARDVLYIHSDKYRAVLGDVVKIVEVPVYMDQNNNIVSVKTGVNSINQNINQNTSHENKAKKGIFNFLKKEKNISEQRPVLDNNIEKPEMPVYREDMSNYYQKQDSNTYVPDVRVELKEDDKTHQMKIDINDAKSVISVDSSLEEKIIPKVEPYEEKNTKDFSESFDFSLSEDLKEELDLTEDEFKDMTDFVIPELPKIDEFDISKFAIENSGVSFGNAETVDTKLEKLEISEETVEYDNFNEDELVKIEIPEQPKMEIPEEIEMEPVKIEISEEPEMEPVKIEIPEEPVGDVILDIPDEEPEEEPEMEPVKIEMPEEPETEPVKIEIPEEPVGDGILDIPDEEPEMEPEEEPLKIEMPEEPEMEPVKIEISEEPEMEPVKIEMPEEPVADSIPDTPVDEPEMEPVKIEVPEEPEMEPVKIEMPEEPVGDSILDTPVDEPEMEPVKIQVPEEPAKIEPQKNIETSYEYQDDDRTKNNFNGPSIQTVTQVIEREVIKEVYETPSDYKKVIAFIGAHKVGTTFVINSIANNLTSKGVKTAILDLTKNKDTFKIYTANNSELRDIASNSIPNLAIGQDVPLRLGDLSIYTGIPRVDRTKLDSMRALEKIRNQNAVILIDCDFTTNIDIFRLVNNIFVVQDMDITNILDITAFLKELKVRDIDLDKVEVIVNKYIKSVLTVGKIVDALSYYTNPEMTFVNELLSNNVKKFVIPFDEQNSLRYIEGLYASKLNFEGFSAEFKQAIASIVYDIFPISSTADLSAQQQIVYSGKESIFKNIFKKKN